MSFMVNQLIGFAAADQYFANAVLFDGTNDYLTRGAELTGNADGKSGIVSVWIDPTGGDGVTQYYFFNSGGHFALQKLAANTINISGYTSAASLILNLTTTTTKVAADGWFHLLASWDLAAGFNKMYWNDTDVTAGTTTTDNTIDYTRGDIAIAADISGGSKNTGNIADFYLNVATSLDITQTDIRRRFRTAAGKPADLGPTGAIPTGTAPIIFLSGPTSAWHTNKGTGGGLTLTGTLTDAATSPSA